MRRGRLIYLWGTAPGLTQGSPGKGIKGNSFPRGSATWALTNLMPRGLETGKEPMEIAEAFSLQHRAILGTGQGKTGKAKCFEGPSNRLKRNSIVIKASDQNEGEGREKTRGGMSNQGTRVSSL